MDKILFFDTETTSLVPKGAKYDTDYDQFPYIVQLAWLFEGELKDFIIFPDGWTIPDDVAEIHGITQEIVLKEGKPFEEVIDKFLADCFFAEKIIGANLYFDTSIIKANLLRLNLDELYYYSDECLDKYKRIDILRKTIKLCGLKQKNSNRPKIPSLIELYWELFNEGFPAHDAGEDVKATKRCFDELIDRGII